MIRFYTGLFSILNFLNIKYPSTTKCATRRIHIRLSFICHYLFYSRSIFPNCNKLGSSVKKLTRNETRTALSIFIGHFFFLSGCWTERRGKGCVHPTHAFTHSHHIYATFTQASQIEFRTNERTRDVPSFTHRKQVGLYTCTYMYVYMIYTKARERISYIR